MKTSELYSIKIACARYVQRYLMRNFGTPLHGHPYLIDIRRDQELRHFVAASIEKPCHRHDKYLSTLLNRKRNTIIEIRISKDQFERCGWQLSKTDELRFNSIIENRCKKDLITFLTLQYSIGETLDTAIDEFYHEYGYSDSSWPRASIQKIWYRKYQKSDLISLKNEIHSFFKEKVMEIMSATKDNISLNNIQENLCIK